LEKKRARARSIFAFIDRPRLFIVERSQFIAERSRRMGRPRLFIGRRSLSFVEQLPFIDDQLR